MSQTEYRWSSATATHPGKVRLVNEDACLALPERGLWVVADGMGGHHAGDVASSMIVDSLSAVHAHDHPASFLDEVEDLLLEVNSSLLRTAAQSPTPRTIGSTVIALLAFREHCVIVWAGDSRAYRLRDGQLQKLTVDHSQVEELVQMGELAPDEAEHHPMANVITRAVGGTERLHLDIELRTLSDADRYLLCSDGLYKGLTDEDIARHLGTGDCETACRELVDAVLAGDASDNVTVAVIDFNAVT